MCYISYIRLSGGGAFTIKVNEERYYGFLARVSNFLEKPTGTQKAIIHEFIREEMELRRLSVERKGYYEFYLKNKDSHPAAAGKAYREYIRTKAALEKFRAEIGEGGE